MLLLASSVCGLFKWRQIAPEVILLAVGWYLRFSLSYRDVEAIHMIRKGQACGSVGLWPHFISRSVRGDELKCRSSIPAFDSPTKVQHNQI
jgi:transposase, IS6 family